MSHAGAVLLCDTIRAAGLATALSTALGPSRKATAVHDPAKILLDLAVSLAADADRALAAIDAARAAARRTVWRRAGVQAPDHEVDHRLPLVVDVDATLVTAHSDKEAAAPTFTTPRTASAPPRTPA